MSRPGEYVTKNDLYKWAENFRRESGWASMHGGAKALRWAMTLHPRLVIEMHDFSTKAVGGILFHGPCQSVMILNRKRSDTELNFDCMHELVHFHRHPFGEHTCASASFERPSRISAYEWQANEGAAETLVPYREFIPLCVEAFSGVPNYSSRLDSGHTVQRLARRFDVTHTVIEHRIRSLNFEIAQFRRGVPIDALQILSRTELKHRRATARYEGEYVWYGDDEYEGHE